MLILLLMKLFNMVQEIPVSLTPCFLLVSSPQQKCLSWEEWLEFDMVFNSCHSSHQRQFHDRIQRRDNKISNFIKDILCTKQKFHHKIVFTVVLFSHYCLFFTDREQPDIW